MSRLGAVAGVLSVSCALAGVSCTSASQAEQRYPITGQVIERRDATGITVAHDAIDNYMPAMTMEVRTDAQVPLGAGDRIRATLVVTRESSRLTDVVVLTSGGAKPPREPFPMRPTTLGAFVPDVILRNQFDQPLRLHDLRGDVAVVTFIYTRCPLPDFCPRLMRNFQELRRALAGRPAVQSKVRLVAVSVDPEFDTPDVLRAYGRARFGSDRTFDRFDLATGEQVEVARLAASLGLRYVPGTGQIVHTMVTAIIGADGRLVKLYPEMTWDLTSALMILDREAARAAND